MDNRVVVTICEQDYTLISDEAPEYLRRIGEYVSGKMSELLSAARVGRSDAAVLTAVNVADELFKEQAASERLRVQIRQYSDETAKAQAEVSELKREIFRLQQKLEGKSARGGR